MVRWLPDRHVLYLQWKDRQSVVHMSTAHAANKFVLAKRRTKVNNKWEEVFVKKPMLIDRHNVGMRGVNKLDQLSGTYNVQRYRNCKLSYEERKVEQKKLNVFCETWTANLCFTTSRNCFARWHDSH